MATLTSSLVVRLIDQVTGPARQMSGALRGLNRAADGGQQRANFGERMANAQARVGGAITANNAAIASQQSALFQAAAGFFVLDRTIGSAVRTAANFETSMNQVKAVSGATEEEFSALRDQAAELGRTTQFTASQAGDAMNFLAMAGFDANQVIGAMPGTLQLASAAQMDLGASADIVSNILTGYQMKTEDLAHVNDVLVKAFTSANTDLRQLGEAMKYAAPVAASAGVQFEEATSAIALMGNAGIQASMAGTSLRGAITRMLSPTPKMTEAMNEAGLSFTDAQGRLIPLADIIEQLEPHAENTGLMMELFGQRAGPAMAALVSQGSSEMRNLTGELEDSGGTAERVANVQMEGFNGAMKRWQSAMEGLAITVGTALLPALTDLANKISEYMGPLTETLEAHPKLTAAVIGTAAAMFALRIAVAGLTFAGLIGKGGALYAVAGGLKAIRTVGTPIAAFFGTLQLRSALAAKTLGRQPKLFERIADGFRVLLRFTPKWALLSGALTAVGTALGSLSAPVWGAIAVVAGLGFTLWKYWDRVSSVVGGAASRISEEFGPAINALEPAINTIRPLFERLSPIVEGIGNAFGTAAGALEDFGGFLGSFFQQEVLTDAEKQSYADAGYAIGDALINAIKEKVLGLVDWFRGVPGMIRDAFGGAVQVPVQLNRLGGVGGGDAPQSVPEAEGSAAGAEIGAMGAAAADGHRARGGPVYSGSAYLVGENEPEIFSPNTSGQITPVSRAGGSVSIGDINVYGASDPAETARQVREILRREYARATRGGHAATRSR